MGWGLSFACFCELGQGDYRKMNCPHLPSLSAEASGNGLSSKPFMSACTCKKGLASG